MAGATTSRFTDTAGARWRRTTPRERLLLTGLALAAAAAAPVAAQGWAAAQVSREAESAARLQQLRATADAGRLRGAQARLEVLEARVRAWSAPAPSFAVARVQAEQDVAVAASQAGLTALEVRAAETPDVIGGIAFVRVELSGGGFAWRRLAELTRRLAAVRAGMVVERAATEGDGADARLRLVLLAPVRTPSA